MKNWIDFRVLRNTLDFEQVLKHYGVDVKSKGKQHHGFCPLPNHNGKRSSPSFSANLERGIFQCFGCKAKGNLLEFAALMEKVDPKNGVALHELALKLQKQFCPGLKSDAPKTTLATKPVKEADTDSELPLIVNEPLNFELKDLD